MPDQTQRLEIATVKAEIGSNILSRFSNDALEAAKIPTESGDIANLHQVIDNIENKASIATTIYQTKTAGLAATAEGGMFLVGSSEPGEIYVVWRKVAGIAVDTGKRALSSQSVEDAAIAADASAEEAAASALAAQQAAANAAAEFQVIFDEDQAAREVEFNQLLLDASYESIYLVYSAGVVVERQTQLVQREGELYRVMDASDIPLVLTGVWATDAPRLQSVGDAALRQILSDDSDPLNGSALIGRQGLIFNTVAEVRTVSGRFEGDSFTVKNYIAGDTKGCKIGGKWRLGTPVVSDDGGMILQVPGDTSGYWERDLNDLGEVDGEVYGLPMAAGQDAHDKLEAMGAYCDAVKLSGFLGKGPMNRGMFVSVPIYDTFERSFPVSGPRDPGQPIRKFGWGIRSERGVTFQTTSSGGADVFNLCSMSDWWLTGFPTIKGFLTGFSGSGSNGVSMVFGGENLLIEADPFQMPQLWIAGGVSDGGNGFTIQYGTGNTNHYKNVKFRGHPRECTSGVYIDFSTTNTILYPMQGVIIDKVIAEDCYRGLARGGTTPDANIGDPRVPQPCVDISGEMTIINCQQSVVDVRSLGGNMVISIINTKEKAALVKNPNDTSVEVARVLGSKFGELMINARVLSVDKVLTLGSLTMGGNAYPSVENFKFGMNVRYTAATTEFETSAPGSAPCSSSDIELTGFVNVPSTFLGASLRTSLKLNGLNVTPTLYAGNAPAEPGPGAVVIFDTALTAVQPVYAPPAVLCGAGDTMTIVRTAAATGGGVTFAGVSVAVGTRANFIYNGSAWMQYP